MRPLRKDLLISLRDVQFVHEKPISNLLALQNHLIDNLGSYCSYCEKSILGYETLHYKLSKELPQKLASNDLPYLLLICGDCQAHQTKELLTIQEYSEHLWPDIDNCFSLHPTSPIRYAKKKVRYIVEDEGKIIFDQIKEMVLVEANIEAGKDLYAKAQNTINLFQLNSAYHLPEENIIMVPLTDELQLVDHRMRERNLAWQAAEGASKRLNSIAEHVGNNANIIELFHKQITMTAQAKGNWSIWMTVFWQLHKNRDLLEKLFIGQPNDTQPEGTNQAHFNGTNKEKMVW